MYVSDRCSMLTNKHNYQLKMKIKTPESVRLLCKVLFPFEQH